MIPNLSKFPKYWNFELNFYFKFFWLGSGQCFPFRRFFKFFNTFILIGSIRKTILVPDKTIACMVNRFSRKIEKQHPRRSRNKHLPQKNWMVMNLISPFSRQTIQRKLLNARVYGYFIKWNMIHLMTAQWTLVNSVTVQKKIGSWSNFFKNRTTISLFKYFFFF